MASLDPVEWAHSEPYDSSEQHAPKEPEEDPYGMSASVCYSSNWEAVNTRETTFLGGAPVALEAGVGVWVPGGTYSGSYSSSDVAIIRLYGATELDLPME